jgi:hypothetical protein
MARKTKWTPRREGLFLDVLRSTGNISAAARAAGVNRKAATTHKKLSSPFSDLWDNALEESLDALEGELRRRALEGTSKPVYYAGKECGSTVNFNDNLGMFLLKSRRSQVYGEEPNKNKSQGLDDAEGARDRLLSLMQPLLIRNHNEITQNPLPENKKEKTEPKPSKVKGGDDE